MLRRLDDIFINGRKQATEFGTLYNLGNSRRTLRHVSYTHRKEENNSASTCEDFDGGGKD